MIKIIFSLLLSIFLTASCASNAQADLATVLPRMEELAPKIAERRCDGAYDHIYRFGEILYRIRVHARLSEDLVVLQPLANSAWGRMADLLREFDEAMPDLGTALTETQAALDPFEELVDAQGFFTYTETDGQVSVHSQALLAGNQKIIDEVTKIRNICSNISTFFPDPMVGAYSPAVDTEVGNVRFTFAQMTSALTLLINDAQAIQDDQNLHFNTVQVFAAVKHVRVRTGLFYGNFLPGDRGYVEHLVESLKNLYDDIGERHTEINEEADVLLEEAEGLYKTIENLCPIQYRIFRNRRSISPATLRRLINDPDSFNPRRGILGAIPAAVSD